MISMEGGGGRSEGAALSEDQLEQMKELYGYDKPIHEAYLIWLGLMPRELNRRDVDFVEFNSGCAMLSKILRGEYNAYGVMRFEGQLG